MFDNYFIYAPIITIACVFLVAMSVWFRSVCLAIVSGVVLCVVICKLVPHHSERMDIVFRARQNTQFFHVNRRNWHGELEEYEYTVIYWKARHFDHPWQEARFDGWRPEGLFKAYSVKNILGQHLFFRYELSRRMNIDRDLATITGGEYVMWK